jgi:hypothetical protein
MDVLKQAIKAVEVQLDKISKLAGTMSYRDYAVKTNSGYNGYYLTPDQQERLHTLLGEFKQEMIDEVAPMQQKLSTLEQLLG